MTYQPIIVGTGLVGWQFLKATQSTQRAAFDSSASISRDADYFEAEISNITSAEQLVADRRLRSVTLGAFGLQDDIENIYFIQKVLQEGTLASDSLANKLSDDRYKAMSSSFAFDSPLGPNTTTLGFSSNIVSKFKAQAFEVAVGRLDESLRLALNFEREIPSLANQDASEDTKWFRVMGTSPLRSVIEKSLSLPSSFGQLDIDKQLEVFRDKMESRFGVSEIFELSNSSIMTKVLEGFLLQTQISETNKTSQNQVALSLLQSMPRWHDGILS